MSKNVRKGSENPDCSDCDLAQGYKRPRVGGPRIKLQGKWSLFHNGDKRTFLGWLLLVPQTHYERWSCLGAAESKWLVPHIKQIDMSLRKYWEEKFQKDPIQRVYIVAFAESRVNSPHVHFHLIPRTKRMKQKIRLIAKGWRIYKVPGRIRRGTSKYRELQKYVIHKKGHNENAKKLMNYLREKLLNQDSSQRDN